MGCRFDCRKSRLFRSGKQTYNGKDHSLFAGKASDRYVRLQCHVPSLNFSLISAFHWSLSDATQLREAGIFNVSPPAWFSPVLTKSVELSLVCILLAAHFARNYASSYPPTLTSDRLDVRIPGFLETSKI